MSLTNYQNYLKLVSANDAKDLASRKEFTGLNINKCIDKLSYGTSIKKLRKRGAGSPHPVTFYIYEDDPTRLQWISTIKDYWRSRIDVTTIRTISEQPLIRITKKMEKYYNQLLCIYYSTDGELLLVFDSPSDKYEWWCGLQYFISRALQQQRLGLGSSVSAIGMDVFNKADKDGNKTLTKDEVKKILREMQLSVDKKSFNEIYQKFDIDKNGLFDRNEFNLFIQTLMEKKELIPLFQKYAKAFDEKKKNEPCMTIQELQQFYYHEQNLHLKIEEIKEIAIIVKEKDPAFAQSKPDLISFYEFSSLIFSNWNTVFDPQRKEIFQDVTRPLSDYYVNSSHNTYLMKGQLTGESSVMAYLNAIELGCRCVEIDLWNGENSEPIVTHGHTLTSKILFKDLIIALRDQGFTKNPYPLILSYEMHCDLRGQEKIANILEAEVKDQIYLIPTDFHEHQFYPTLESLKNKFIIKCKGRKLSKEQVVSSGEESEEDEDNQQNKNPEPKYDQAKIEIIKKYGQGIVDLGISHAEEQKKSNTEVQGGSDPVKLSLLKSSQDQLRGNMKTSQPEQHAQKSADLKENDSKKDKTAEGAAKGKKTKEPKHKVKTLERLANYYSLLGSKFDYKITRTIWEISSLSEGKINSLYKHDPKAVIDFTKKHFIRIYPAGKRFDSSNFDPCKSWLAGAQMVALNFQTSGEPMLLNYAKFNRNGGIGYVLKPEYMLSDTIAHTELTNYPHKMTTPKLNISIKIISGQQFTNEGEVSGRDIVDPYVEVKLRGTDMDEAQNNVYKTPVIQDNGFNPWWSKEQDCVHHFKISAPDFATLVFKVFDENLGKDEKLAWYAIEVNDIQAGYRVIPMLNSKFEPIKHCYLFVHIKITPYK